MKSQGRRLVGLIIALLMAAAVVVGLVTVGRAAAGAWGEFTLRRTGAFTLASVESTRFVNQKVGADYLASYTFEVDGRRYSGEGLVGQQPGAELPIYYDAADPSHNVPEDATETDALLLVLALPVIAVAAGLLLWVRQRRRDLAPGTLTTATAPAFPGPATAPGSPTTATAPVVTATPPSAPSAASSPSADAYDLAEQIRSTALTFDDACERLRRAHPDLDREAARSLIARGLQDSR